MHDISYDFVLNMNTHSDPEMLERSTEALCGTREQVHSILGAFRSEMKLGKRTSSRHGDETSAASPARPFTAAKTSPR